jgi:TRAP-type C4-dicarboxylate transport system permease large subunit
VAILLLIACRIGNVEYLATLRPLMPFLATLLVVLLAVSYLPGLVLFLPEWALGYQPRT